MSAQDAFLTLKKFFETRNAAKQAMNAIKVGVEIGIVIGGSVECAMYRQDDQVIVENRPANKPDVVFYIRPETVYVLASQTKDEMGEIGVNVLKEILAGNIQVKIPGRFLNILSHGYLDMIRQGGAPVTSFLARNGPASVSKIIGTIKRIKG